MPCRPRAARTPLESLEIPLAWDSQYWRVLAEITPYNPHPSAAREQGAKPKLLDRPRHAIRVSHYSRRTEEAYVLWVRRFIVFHRKRHPRELGGAEVAAFLTSLATERRVAASTQNQALAALLFLYRDVPGMPLGPVESAVRARTPVRVPVVLSRAEVRALLGELRCPARIIGVHQSKPTMGTFDALPPP